MQLLEWKRNFLKYKIQAHELVSIPYTQTANALIYYYDFQSAPATALPLRPGANIGQTVFEKVSEMFPYMSYTNQ